MNSHKNARLTFEGRKLRMERIAVMGLKLAAEAAGISASTVRKWRKRFDQQGLDGLKPGLVRYEREAPRELLHMDTKKLGGASCIPAIASRATGAIRSRVPAGSSPTSPSKTIRAWPLCRCIRTKRSSLPWNSSRRRWHATKRWVSPSNARSLTTARPTARSCLPAPAKPWCI